ncbi:MAG: hypothetical protein SFW64_02450 [Alphaproteobacteria bacterium]|nr:hypothetical protein [Alphaproteobacteria bacterium]
MADQAPGDPAAYIIEFVQQGRYVKVTAVDPVSGREAVIVGDPRELREVLERNAVNKLKFLLKNK